MVMISAYQLQNRSFLSTIFLSLLISMTVILQGFLSSNFIIQSADAQLTQESGDGSSFSSSPSSIFGGMSNDGVNPSSSSVSNINNTGINTALASTFDNQGVYTIQFPSDWTISTNLASAQQQSQQGTTVTSSPFANILGGSSANAGNFPSTAPTTIPPTVKLNTTFSYLEVIVVSSPTTLNTQQFQTQAQNFPYVIESLYPGITILKTEYGKYKIDGRDAASYPFSSVVPNTQGLNINLTGFAVIAPMASSENNRFMTIAFVSLPSVYQQILPEVNQILSSIRIEGNNGANNNSGGGFDNNSNLGNLGAKTSSTTNTTANTQLENSLLNEGILLYNQGNYTGSIDAYDKVLQLNATNIYAWYYRGLALEQLGRYQEATQSYDRALQIDPNYVDALHEKASLQSRLNSSSNTGSGTTNNNNNNNNVGFGSGVIQTNP
jgi:tetratricopeptide (TPR) repeat protein